MEPSRKKKSSHRDLFESGVYFDGEGNFGKNPSQPETFSTIWAQVNVFPLSRLRTVQILVRITLS